MNQIDLASAYTARHLEARMPVNYPVPFYGNTPDNTRCAQAAMKSVRKYFEPELEFSWDELDQGTGKIGTRATWRMTGLLWLKNNGYEVEDIETLDYAAFAEYGEEYLNHFYGIETARWQVIHSDIPAERARAREFAKANILQRRIPNQEDIRHYLNEGYIVQVSVNANRLNHEPGYGGHAVLVKGYGDSFFVTHDPGLPPRPDRIVPYDMFEYAWADPSDNCKHLAAYRKLEKK